MDAKGMRAKLLELFTEYDPVIKEIVSEVLAVEQEYLSMTRPRGAKERIGDIVDRVAKDEIGQHQTI